MIRVVLLVTIIVGLVAPLQAEPASAEKAAAKPQQIERIRLATRQGPAEFVITRETEIKLDGRDCKWENVPDGAVITAIAVDAADDTTVLRISFRSKKK